MLVSSHPFLRRLARPLALTLGLVSLLFLLQVTVHTHTGGQDGQACRLCQVAHSGLPSMETGSVLSVPLVSFGEVCIRSVVLSADPDCRQSSSRAPPSLSVL